MENPILLYYVTATIFTLMLGIGINYPIRDLVSLWRQRDLLVRSLLAVIVLVPLWVAILLLVFNLPLEEATGLALLAAAPGAPLMNKRTQLATGHTTYAPSLLLTQGLLAVVVTPVIVGIFNVCFDFPTARVSIYQVALQVGEVTFLPVLIGLLIRRFAPGTAERIGKPVRVIGDVMFGLMALLLIVLLAAVSDARAMLLLGWTPVLGIIAMAGGGLAIGHLLGGPSLETRSTLAIASIARNVGLALFIAGLYDYGQLVIFTIISYMLLGSVMGILYSIWCKRHMAKEVTIA